MAPDDPEQKGYQDTTAIQHIRLRQIVGGELKAAESPEFPSRGPRTPILASAAHPTRLHPYHPIIRHIPTLLPPLKAGRDTVHRVTMDLSDNAIEFSTPRIILPDATLHHARHNSPNVTDCVLGMPEKYQMHRFGCLCRISTIYHEFRLDLSIAYRPVDGQSRSPASESGLSVATTTPPILPFSF